MNRFFRGKCLVAVAALSLSVAAPAHALYRVSSEYSASATHSDGIPLAGDDIYDYQDHVDGTYTKTGDFGNYGTCWFWADHSEARVAMTASSHGVEYAENYCATGSGRVERIDVWDNLTFAVPAGFYPDGVVVRMPGHARGTISSNVGGGAEAGCWASFGADVYQTGLLVSGVDVASTIIVNDDFSLEQVLVNPGATLNQLTYYTRQVRILMHRSWTWSVSYNTGDGYVTGDGNLDFSEGVWIAGVHPPAGVTWTSESGVFLNHTSSVPGEVAGGPRLLQNHPNPFNPGTEIGFELDRTETVRLAVFGLDGRLVRTLLDGTGYGPGRHEVPWDGRDEAGRTVAAGTYLYRIDAGDLRETRRLTLLR